MCYKNEIPFKKHEICCKFKKIGSWALILLGVTLKDKNVGLHKDQKLDLWLKSYNFFYIIGFFCGTS